MKPVESAFVSYLSFGEGWHNYHHAFPWDYRAAEFGTRYSFTTFLINLLAKTGQAYDLRTTTPQMIARRVQRTGDGTHIYHEEIMAQNYGQKVEDLAEYFEEDLRDESDCEKVQNDLVKRPVSVKG